MASWILFLALAEAVAAASWNYTHPHLWPLTNAECAGRRQSPIDIVTTTTVAAGPEFLRLYAPIMTAADLQLTNNGHTLQVSLTQRNLRFASSTFPDLMEALQFHLHTPSEHTIDGVSYPLELHVVTATPDATLFEPRFPLAVFGLIYNVGTTEDLVLASILQLASQVNAANTSTTAHFIPNFDLGKDFYEYDGSLTTPPCYQTVHWMVSAQIRSATQAQIDALVAIMGNNARPVQPLNSRPIKKTSFYASDVARSCPTASASSSAPAAGSTILNFAGMVQTGSCSN
eukprot:TRINITY_DN5855_c0_g1_i1.p1 TRINITY_DN5855_c0_g1~~TRINITY_DN5855_c0_g1_i1.p1  ORF type:complete len:287 (+),score=50.52 TRINITY_DN5855_c0_g1_i1:49-909(+)